MSPSQERKKFDPERRENKGGLNRETDISMVLQLRHRTMRFKEEEYGIRKGQVKIYLVITLFGCTSYSNST